jgi:beta-phosphoglucomutase-like phosphatase (HAD superfamily)
MVIGVGSPGHAMLQATLFDFNGVLVDDEALHLEGFNAALRPAGVTVSLDEYNERYLGFDDRGAFSAMLRDRGLDHGDERIAALIAAKSVVYAELAARSLTVFEGAARLLRSAAERGPVAIVSGALRGEIDVALRLMGAERGPGVIVAAEDVAACKPDPEGYLLGLSRLAATGGRARPGALRGRRGQRRGGAVGEGRGAARGRRGPHLRPRGAARGGGPRGLRPRPGDHRRGPRRGGARGGLASSLTFRAPPPYAENAPLAARWSVESNERAEGTDLRVRPTLR